MALQADHLGAIVSKALKSHDGPVSARGDRTRLNIHGQCAWSSLTLDMTWRWENSSVAKILTFVEAVVSVTNESNAQSTVFE